METLTLEEVAPQVVLLTMNRPHRLNAITLKMYDELDETVESLAGDRGIRVVIVTGAGRGFCSGQDLTELRAPTRPRRTSDACSTGWPGRPGRRS